MREHLPRAQDKSHYVRMDEWRKKARKVHLLNLEVRRLNVRLGAVKNLEKEVARLEAVAQQLRQENAFLVERNSRFEPDPMHVLSFHDYSYERHDA